MANLTLSRVLGTQIPTHYDPETFSQSSDRMDILKNSSRGVLITALLEQLGYPLFPKEGEPKKALPISADNEVTNDPNKVEAVFIVEKSTLITPLQDMGLILATLEELRPAMTPIPETNLFTFTVKGGQSFESTIPEAAIILQLYMGLSPTLVKSKEGALSHIPEPQEGFPKELISQDLAQDPSPPIVTDSESKEK